MRLPRSLEKVVTDLRTKDDAAQRQLETAYEAAYYIEHGKLDEVLDRLTRRTVLLKQQFVAGVARGVLTAVGLVLLVAIVTALLGTAGQALPGGAGEFARELKASLQEKGR